MNPVGYLTNTVQGLVGDPGIGYDYILAANGVFLRASNPLLTATIQIAPAEVRGLAPLTESLELVNGRIPLELIQNTLTFDTLGHREFYEREFYMAVVWQDGVYHEVIPGQHGSPASVEYQRPRHALLDLHTHGKMSAFFSGTDDRDEQGFQLYAVLGRLDQPVKEVALRLGVYGCFAPLAWDEVFIEPLPSRLQVVSPVPNFEMRR